MTHDLWFISDTHFGHKNILTFKDTDGAHFRGDHFTSCEIMDETMIENWNKRIKPHDKVYHLGDVGYCSNRHLDSILSRLNGHKRLVLGNHDKIGRNSPLVKHFDKIKLWWPFEGILFTHVPTDGITGPKKCTVNVHGHIHQNKAKDDGKHVNICVENTGYNPLNYEDIKWMVKGVSK